jgi:uncharacterized SAM-binding protein YcdF (DUF218 family)
MFFALSKIIGFFVSPANVLLLSGIVGVLLLRTRLARTGWWVTAVSLFALATIGLSPLGNALIIPLEQRFPPPDESRDPPDGIVILGGAVSADISDARNVQALNEAAERMTVAVALVRRYPNVRAIFTGGSGNLVYDGNESAGAMRLFESLGVPPGRIMTEDKSRNTYENAVFTKRIVDPKPGERWYLVTSAYHLPRAVGVFRQAGFPVIGYPVDWRTRGPQDMLRPFSVLGEGIRRTDLAVKEWAGLLVYWLTGRLSELYPGPAASGA